MINRKIVIILSVLGVVLIGFLVFSKLIINFFPPLWSLINPRAPRPQVTYGEFSFRLEYEIQGEQMVITDTIIVQHAGTSWNAGVGNHNVWETRLLSNSPEIIELYRSRTEVIFIRILGELNAHYLLGSTSPNPSRPFRDLPNVTRLSLEDEDLFPQDEVELQTFFSEDKNPNWRFFGGTRWQIDEEELFNTYGIRLISFEYDPPIENSFR